MTDQNRQAIAECVAERRVCTPVERLQLLRQAGARSRFFVEETAPDDWHPDTRADDRAYLRYLAGGDSRDPRD